MAAGLSKDQYLEPEEYVPFAPEDPGHEININHESCPAGTDTKKRLHVKRTEDNARILGYCHHCGQRGSFVLSRYSTTKAKKARRFSGIVRDPTRTVLRFPRDYQAKPSDWPRSARIWVRRYGITEEEIERFGIGYSEFLGRVILPVFQDGELLLYQTRRIFDSDMDSKYKTRKRDNKVQQYFHVRRGSDTCVLVEDYLSAVKCSRYVDAMCLMTTSLSDEALARLLGYEHVIVFLDDDNHVVWDAQRKITQRLSLLVPDTKLIRHINKDPKELNNKQLKEILL